MEKTKTIEILFPEFCNLYGDFSNMKYLKKCITALGLVLNADVVVKIFMFDTMEKSF